MKPIPIKELLLNQKRLDEITKIYSSLSELEVILDRVEVGGFKSQEKNKCIVKCIEIERNKKDKGCMWATFYFMGYKVRMGFVKDSFCYISTIEFEDIKYPLRSGEKVVKSPFDIAVKAEGSVGKIGRGTDRTKVIAVIKSGTPLIVGPQNKLLEIAACANPVYEYRLLCTKDIKMKDGSVKKFLYMPISSTDAKFEDADGVVRDIAQMSELTGTEIKFTK